MKTRTKRCIEKGIIVVKIPFILLTCFLLSCKQQPGHLQEEQLANFTESSEDEESESINESEPCDCDTIIESGSYDLGEFHIKFDALNFNYYCCNQNSDYDEQDNEENLLLAKDSKFVQKKKNKLTLKLDNGKTKVLKSSDEEDDLPYGHTYLGYIPEINKYIVRAGMFEWSVDFLVDKTTGESLEIYDTTNIAVSPNKKYFACRGHGQIIDYYIERQLIIYSNTPTPEIMRKELFYDERYRPLPPPIKNWKFNGKFNHISDCEGQTYELKWIDNKTIYFKTDKTNLEERLGNL